MLDAALSILGGESDLKFVRVWSIHFKLYILLEPCITVHNYLIFKFSKTYISTIMLKVTRLSFFDKIHKCKFRFQVQHFPPLYFIFYRKHKSRDVMYVNFCLSNKNNRKFTFEITENFYKNNNIIIIIFYYYKILHIGSHIFQFTYFSN